MVQPYRDRSETDTSFRCRAPAAVLFFAVSLVLWLLGQGLGLEKGYALILDAESPTLASFFSSHLFHLNGFHLSFTLLIVLIAGGILETRWGTPRFVAFYLFTAWGTALVALACGLFTSESTGQLSCGATGVALGSVVTVGLFYPDHRVVRILPPAKHLAWVLVFLVSTGLAILPVWQPDLLQRDRVYFYLPQVFGVAFALLFVRLDSIFLEFLDRWRARRARGRREKAVAMRLRVDELLDKISSSGYESLTSDEKTFLRHASKHYRMD
jgi:membrane associated rhomboid family serine protease